MRPRQDKSTEAFNEIASNTLEYFVYSCRESLILRGTWFKSEYFNASVYCSGFLLLSHLTEKQENVYY